MEVFLDTVLNLFISLFLYLFVQVTPPRQLDLKGHKCSEFYGSLPGVV